MDNSIHNDFQGYSMQDLFKGRDALKTLYDLGFTPECDENAFSDLLYSINLEIERRSKEFYI